MNDTFTIRLRGAVIAGWWSLLIWFGMYIVSWLIWLGFMHRHPAWWLNAVGGGDLTWSAVQTMGLWWFGVYKFSLWVLLMILIWMSLWLRRLRKSAG